MSGLFALSWTPTRPQLFRFSALSWNSHLIHLDRAEAQRYELEDVVAQSQLSAAVVVYAFLSWLGRDWQVVRVDWRNRSPVYVDRVLSLAGSPRYSPNGQEVSLAAEGRTEDGTLCLTIQIRAERSPNQQPRETDE